MLNYIETHTLGSGEYYFFNKEGVRYCEIVKICLKTEVSVWICGFQYSGDNIEGLVGHAGHPECVDRLI